MTPACNGHRDERPVTLPCGHCEIIDSAHYHYDRQAGQCEPCRRRASWIAAMLAPHCPPLQSPSLHGGDYLFLRYQYWRNPWDRGPNYPYDVERFSVTD